MGWSSGSRLFDEVIHLLKETVPDYETRVEIYQGLIPIFENADCDTLMECLDEDRAFDDAYFELYPGEDDEGDEIYDDDDINLEDDD